MMTEHLRVTPTTDHAPEEVQGFYLRGTWEETFVKTSAGAGAAFIVGGPAGVAAYAWYKTAH